MITLLVLTALFGANVVLTTLLLWFGARWLKAGKPYFARALVATIALIIMGAVVFIATSALEAGLELEANPATIMKLATLIGEGLLFALFLRVLMKTTFPRAILLWFICFIPGIAGLGLAFGVVKPYVTEAFIVPTNGMAPTVMGWHMTTVCPHCQGSLIVPSSDPYSPDFNPVLDEQFGICMSCLKSSKTRPIPGAIHAPDRIMVNKLLAPRRWDMIEFRFPPKPSEKRMTRLVGLPGETVYIKDGGIWINDAKAELPAPLNALQYVTDLDGVPVTLGTPENPFRLGPDEYCVLGDFSLRSADSRFWGPVPRANVEGVVSVCYWPISRWRVFR
jgi:signal peptidase I